MSEYLPKAVQEAMLKRVRTRMRVEAGGISFQILRLSDRGFVLDSKDAPGLRGLVNVYDGTRHLCQGLVVACDTENGETEFEYKRRTPPLQAPPLDFEQTAPEPAIQLASPR